MNKNNLRGLLDDFFILSGFAGLTFGIYQLSPPIAFIVGGIVLIAVGVMGSLSRSINRDQ